MGVQIKDYLWGLIPESLRQRDGNKNAQGKGLLERFLSIFGEELNEEVVPLLENLINQLDPETADDIYLSELAFQVARPKDILEDLNIYRLVLKQIISLYKIKGTAKSYTFFFNLLGMHADIVEHLPLDNVYDAGLIYDDNSANAHVYDETSCEVGCVEYSINYYNLPGKTVAPLTGDLRANVIAIIQEFLEPVDCKLRDLIYTPPVTP